MAGQDVAQVPQWTVIGINPTIDVTTGNQPVKGNNVTFTTALGHRGTVFVADNVPVPAGAKTIIAAAASRADGLATLTG